jgi:hypothetical protein
MIIEQQICTTTAAIVILVTFSVRPKSYDLIGFTNSRGSDGEWRAR